MLHIEHDTETVYLGVGHEEEALHLRFLCRSDNLYQLRMLQIIGKVTADKIDNIAS